MYRMFCMQPSVFCWQQQSLYISVWSSEASSVVCLLVPAAKRTSPQKLPQRDWLLSNWFKAYLLSGKWRAFTAWVQIFGEDIKSFQLKTKSDVDFVKSEDIRSMTGVWHESKLCVFCFLTLSSLYYLMLWQYCLWYIHANKAYWIESTPLVKSYYFQDRQETIWTEQKQLKLNIRKKAVFW